MGFFEDFVKKIQDGANNVGNFLDPSGNNNSSRTLRPPTSHGNIGDSVANYFAPKPAPWAAGPDNWSAPFQSPDSPAWMKTQGQAISAASGGSSAPGIDSAPWMQPTGQQVPQFDFASDNGGTQSDSNPMDAALQSIKDRLGQNYSFDRSKVDTSDFDAALASRMATIEKAKADTNSSFATSDANLKGMHDAFQQDARAQTPEIQAQYDQSGQDLKGIFDNTINTNNAEQAKQQKVKEEMLQRLGIAPAANQIDPTAQAVAQGNANAAQGRDSRLAENVVNKQSAVDNNNNFANVVGSEGVQRRSDLNSQLQDILGKLNGQGADYQDAANTQKMNWVNGQDDKSYQRFLGDRNFDFSQLQEINSDNRATAAANAKAQSDAIAAQAKAGVANQPTGFDGLWGQTPDAVKQAYQGIQGKVDVNDQQAVMRKVQKEFPNTPVTEFLSFYTNLRNLGTTNKFPVTQ